MSRSRLLFLLIPAVCLIAVVPALAQAGSLTDDIFTDGNGNVINAPFLVFGAQGAGGACTDSTTTTTWLQFMITGHMTGADLMAPVEGGSLPTPVDIVLYSASTGWSETGTTEPTLGTELARLQSVGTISDTLMFDSTALDNHLATESAPSGDQNVAFGMQIEGCADNTTYTLQLHAKDDADGLAPTLANPTRVSLRSVAATGGERNSMLLGIAVVALFGLVVAPLVLRRKNGAN